MLNPSSGGDSRTLNESGKTCVPLTYPYGRDVYFIQGDVGNSPYDPSSPPLLMD